MATAHLETAVDQAAWELRDAPQLMIWTATHSDISPAPQQHQSSWRNQTIRRTEQVVPNVMSEAGSTVAVRASQTCRSVTPAAGAPGAAACCVSWPSRALTGAHSFTHRQS